MDTAHELVEQAVGETIPADFPARVKDIIERHRQTLLILANALLAAGRGEDEVAEIIQKASESFSARLKSEAEGLQL